MNKGEEEKVGLEEEKQQKAEREIVTMKHKEKIGRAKQKNKKFCLRAALD